MRECRICGRAMPLYHALWTGDMICRRARCRHERDDLATYRVWEHDHGSPHRSEVAEVFGDA